MGPTKTPTERYYTRAEAADLCGTSRDTIKRADRAGRLPNARRRPGCASGTLEYPYGDLVNAGLYDPPAAGEEPEEAIRRVRDERRVLELTTELADAQARVEVSERTIEVLTKETARLIRAVERLSAALSGGGR
jgi:hypothetical protein